MADFGWALEQLRAGKGVLRPGWGDFPWTHIPATGMTYEALMAEDWELYEEPKPELGTFTKAMEAAIRIKVRRAAWPSDRYVCLGTYGYVSLCDKLGPIRDYSPSHDDIFATDWKYA